MPERDANQLAANELLQPRWQTYLEHAQSVPETDPPHPAAATASLLYNAALDLKAAVALVGTLQQERDAERRWCKHWAERAEAAEAALAEKDAALTNMTGWHNEANRDLRAAEAALADLRRQMEELREQGLWPVSELADRLATTRQALTDIAEQQPKTLDWLRSHGIVFDGPLGTNPDHWEHVAFAIYTELCEADSIARRALADTGGDTKHPEATCEDCGRRNPAPWSVPNEIWNQVVGTSENPRGEGLILCPGCFALRAAVLANTGGDTA